MVSALVAIFYLATGLVPVLAVPSAKGTGTKFDAQSTGQITWFNPSLCACGETNGDGDTIVAVAASIFDKNKPCNRKISVSYQGRSIQVRVVDRCVSCAENDLDLSPSAFQQIVGDLGKGRVAADWHWV